MSDADKPRKKKPKSKPKGSKKAAERAAARAVAAEKRRAGEILSGVFALIIAAPFVYMFASAVADGVRRANEAPIIAMIGDEAYASLKQGETPPTHYYGNDRLAPDFALLDRAGRRWRLEDHRGKVVVLNFWSITCRPCIEEMPSLLELARLTEHRDDVEVVAVSTDSGWEEVAGLFPRGSGELTILFDPDKSVVREQFGTRLYPETWIIDSEGVIRLRVDGPRDWGTPLVLELIDRFAS